MSLAAVRSAFSERGRSIFLRYIAIAAGANLVWETAQIPLYTIWRTGRAGEIAFAIGHCTAGDVLISAAALLLALLLAGRAAWPSGRGLPVIAAATMLGIAYTVFSEWLNVSVRGSCAVSTQRLRQSSGRPPRQTKMASNDVDQFRGFTGSGFA